MRHPLLIEHKDSLSADGEKDRTAVATIELAPARLDRRPIGRPFGPVRINGGHRLTGVGLDDRVVELADVHP